MSLLLMCIYPSLACLLPLSGVLDECVSLNITWSNLCILSVWSELSRACFRREGSKALTSVDFFPFIIDNKADWRTMNLDFNVQKICNVISIHGWSLGQLI